MPGAVRARATQREAAASVYKHTKKKDLRTALGLDEDLRRSGHGQCTAQEARTVDEQTVSDERAAAGGAVGR
jgi:hypothetical protein